jgi:hypothetical protein
LAVHGIPTYDPTSQPVKRDNTGEVVP